MHGSIVARLSSIMASSSFTNWAFWLVLLIHEVHSHGRLMVPPARNSMWRFGFSNPVDYNDNELFCGGYKVQHEDNNGKCGICGDDYRLPTPRPHENGGLYGNKIIGRRYNAGQNIAIQVDLTSNHMGTFLFHICPAVNDQIEVTSECLDKLPLKVVNEDNSVSDNFKITTHDKSGTFNLTVSLPSVLVCDRCVFRWTYITGNTWGTCVNGTEAEGCGPQENFINCADIQITNSSSLASPHWEKSFPHHFISDLEVKVSHQVCLGNQNQTRVPELDVWCQTSCVRYPSHCPASNCHCIESCSAVGEFSKNEMADQWCLDQCTVYPQRSCAEDRCHCW